MTGLRPCRKIAKRLIIFSFAWEVAVTIEGLVLLIHVTVHGSGAPSPDSLITVVGTLGL
jgi:hypothetical protein